MTTPVRTVSLEAASLLLNRAASPQFAQFLSALREDREAAVRNMLSASTADALFAAQGAVLTLDRLLNSMENAEAILTKRETQNQTTKGRAP